MLSPALVVFLKLLLKTGNWLSFIPISVKNTRKRQFSLTAVNTKTMYIWQSYLIFSFGYILTFIINSAQHSTFQLAFLFLLAISVFGIPICWYELVRKASFICEFLNNICCKSRKRSKFGPFMKSLKNSEYNKQAFVVLLVATVLSTALAFFFLVVMETVLVIYPELRNALPSKNINSIYAPTIIKKILKLQMDYLLYIPVAYIGSCQNVLAIIALFYIKTELKTLL